VRSKRVWAGLLGVEQVVVESVRFEPIVSVGGEVGAGDRVVASPVWAASAAVSGL
jgi:hypothetical protein